MRSLSTRFTILPGKIHVFIGFIWRHFALHISFYGRECIFHGLALMFVTKINRYSDSEFEYRHVQLPKNMLKKIPSEYFDATKGTLKLLHEEEWRGLGITQVR